GADMDRKMHSFPTRRSSDLVPPGDDAAWMHPPFAAAIANGQMYGRGAVDMKGGIACFVAALARYVEAKGTPKGSVSFLITGDERSEEHTSELQSRENLVCRL